jgi:hypothetical protein
MDANSSKPISKGKGRAPEYSHLPASGQNDTEPAGKPSDSIDWISEDESASDNLGGIGQQHIDLHQHLALKPILSRSVRFDGIDEADQAMTDVVGDTDMSKPTRKGLVSFQDDLPSPPCQRLRRPYSGEPPLYAASRGPQDADLDEDVDIEVAFQQAPTATSPQSPRPRHRELHPKHVSIGEGNLQLGNFEEEEVEVGSPKDRVNVEDFDLLENPDELDSYPSVEYWSTRVGVGNFHLFGHFETRLEPQTWDPCSSRHIVQHPSTTAMFRTCFLECLPAFYQHTVEHHRGQ